MRRVPFILPSVLLGAHLCCCEAILLAAPVQNLVRCWQQLFCCDLIIVLDLIWQRHVVLPRCTLSIIVFDFIGERNARHQLPGGCPANAARSNLDMHPLTQSNAVNERNRFPRQDINLILFVLLGMAPP